MSVRLEMSREQYDLLKMGLHDASSMRAEGFVHCRDCLADEPCPVHRGDYQRSEEYDDLLIHVQKEAREGP